LIKSIFEQRYFGLSLITVFSVTNSTLSFVECSLWSIFTLSEKPNENRIANLKLT